MKNSIKILVAILLLVISTSAFAQNTVVTDDEAYTPDSSAVLDVYSQVKGLLIPRMSSDARIDIENPAEGLMVYDTTFEEFYFYKNDAWTPVAGPELWETNGEFIYMNHPDINVGIGTDMTESKLSVIGDIVEDTVPIFEVQNSNGVVVFAVYNNGVEILTDESTKGVKGGFAVGGLTPGKSTPTEYMKITPDSIRMNVSEPLGKGVKGGFAVGGLTPGKDSDYDLFKITTDSTRVYIKEQGTKGVKGGFAVGGLTPGKTSMPDFMSIDYSGINFNANGAPFQTVADSGYFIFSQADSMTGVFLGPGDLVFNMWGKGKSQLDKKQLDMYQNQIIEQQKARIEELERQLAEIRKIINELKK